MKNDRQHDNKYMEILIDAVMCDICSMYLAEPNNFLFAPTV